jgi:DNA-binding HxlR family transcriptional regulator
MWEKVSFVRRGKLRTQILENLIRPNNPTDLAKKLNSHRPTVSQALGELKAQNLVKRLNPNEKNISIYGLTGDGMKVLKAIHEMKYWVAADREK